MAALLVISGASQAQPAKVGTYVEGNKLAFSLPDMNGEIVSLTDEKFMGKVVLVDLLASWCRPCHDEAPFLAEMLEKYGDDGFMIIGVAFEAERGKGGLASLKQFAEKHGIKYTLVLGGVYEDATRVLENLRNFQGVPTDIVIGRDGMVKSVHVGFEDAMKEQIEHDILAALAQ